MTNTNVLTNTNGVIDSVVRTRSGEGNNKEMTRGNHPECFENTNTLQIQIEIQKCYKYRYKYK